MKRQASITPWPKPTGGPHPVACHFCDTLHEGSAVPEGSAARCRRCGVLLYQNRPASLVRVTAFSLAALILMAMVNMFPFLSMEANGIKTELSLLRAASELIREGSVTIGWCVAGFTIIAPLMMACSMLYVCGPLLRGRAAPGARYVASWLGRTEPWNMIEVFLLGVLVSLMKLGKMAELHFGVGFWAFAALMVCMAAAVAGIDRNELWDRLEVAAE
ncbi:MAG: paraquat-inducible protein A [Verrucomicrobia bacterium]|nr:MAG: paraquat-inducible protein A [Verrucomicrobiota bacterium]